MVLHKVTSADMPNRFENPRLRWSRDDVAEAVATQPSTVALDRRSQSRQNADCFPDYNDVEGTFSFDSSCVRRCDIARIDVGISEARYLSTIKEENSTGEGILKSEETHRCPTPYSQDDGSLYHGNWTASASPMYLSCERNSIGNTATFFNYDCTTDIERRAEQIELSMRHSFRKRDSECLFKEYKHLFAPGFYFKMVMFLYGERKMFIVIMLHLAATLVIWCKW